VENAPVITIVIVTLGLALLLNGLMSLIWGGGNRQFHGPFSTRTIDVGGVPISVQDIGIVVVSLALVVLLGLFFRFTKLGLALRASALNPDSSRLVGVRVGSMLAFGWGLAAVLGAVAGMMVAPVVFLDPNMMQTILLYAFAAAVLGGLDSPVGAVVGGLLLGVTITLLGRYVGFVGSALKLPTALLLILLLLLARPGGLFGSTAVRRA
jgi:branched-chain amino acid transport system permease protein